MLIPFMANPDEVCAVELKGVLSAVEQPGKLKKKKAKKTNLAS